MAGCEQQAGPGLLPLFSSNAALARREAEAVLQLEAAAAAVAAASEGVAQQQKKLLRSRQQLQESERDKMAVQRNAARIRAQLSEIQGVRFIIKQPYNSYLSVINRFV